MDNFDFEKLIDAWIVHVEVKDGTPQSKSNWWAMDTVLDWMIEGKHELLWEFTLRAYRREMSDEVIATLTAGPLETLLAKHGADYIARVEALAEEDERFNYLLGGAWRSTCSSEVWERVQRARKVVW